MGTEKKLSVIVPLFNVEQYAERAAKSIFSQAFDGLEVVLVDDGSTDNSLGAFEEFLMDASNEQNLSVVSIRQKNEGLSSARNAGIRAASGEYVMFLDGDDVLLSGGLNSIYAGLAARKTDVLMGKYVIMQEKGREIWPEYSFPAASSASAARAAIYSEVLDSVWNAWRYVCKRDFLLDNELFFIPGIICEDMEWTPRVLRAANSIAFTDAPFYGYYYNRPGCITRTYVGKRIKDVNSIAADSVEKYIDEPYGEALTYRLIRESFYCMSRYCLCSRAERKELRPAIERAIEQYHHSPSAIIRLFLTTKNIVPIYIWSVMLFLAKSARGALKSILGPITLRRRATVPSNGIESAIRLTETKESPASNK